MTDVLQKIVKHKQTEIAAAQNRVPLAELKAATVDAPPIRDFLSALVDFPAVRLIAEVKKASPSKGVIREDFHPVRIGETYASSGAACVSVLTDEFFFQGHLDFLQQIRLHVEIPILRKDFILDEYQVFEARVAGADAVLLIAECLEPDRLRDLFDLITELGMTPLVELYEPENLDAVLACRPAIIGINNRNLKSFETDLQHTFRIMKNIPESIKVVSESGIFTRNDVELLQIQGVQAMLVGESLMSQNDIGAAVHELLGIKRD